jgi:subtilisin
MSSLSRALQESFESLHGRVLSPVKVAVIDSGIDATHSDLRDRIICARAASKIDGRPGIIEQEVPANHDTYGHGTAVASIIAGIASNSILLDYRVLGPDNTGTGEFMVAALSHAIRTGCRVINMSMAARAEFAPRLQELCDDAYRNGQVVVAAKRNMPLSDLGYPAELTSVISVDLASFPTKFCVRYLPDNIIEFVGHGEDVVVAAPGGGHTTKSGTSFATPAISGIVALLLGAYPDLRPFEIKSILRARSES